VGLVSNPGREKVVNIYFLFKDVNPDTFLKVLLGDEEGLKGIGSGKVLKR